MLPALKIRSVQPLTCRSKSCSHDITMTRKALAGVYQTKIALGSAVRKTLESRC